VVRGQATPTNLTSMFLRTTTQTLAGIRSLNDQNNIRIAPHAAIRSTMLRLFSRLPTYLPVLHWFRSARSFPTLTDQSSDVPISNFSITNHHTWKPPDISSLHNAYRTGPKLKLRANSISFFMFQETFHKFNTIQKRMVELIGIEPMTPCLQSRCSPS
jgi:hypothetical protein